MNKTRVIIYVRVSTGESRQDTSRQIYELTNLAIQRGWHILKHPLTDNSSGIIQENISGMKGNREGINTVLKIAAKGDIDKVLVHEPSRFGRKLSDACVNIDKLCDYKTSLFVLSSNNETLDDSRNKTDYYNILLPMLLMISQQESRTQSMRIRSGIEAKRRRNDGKVRDGKPVNRSSIKQAIAIKALRSLNFKEYKYSDLKSLGKNIGLSYATMYRAKQHLLTQKI